MSATRTITDSLPPGCILHGREREYRIEKVLGQGSFGITYLATTSVEVTGPLGILTADVQVAVKEFFMREVNGREGSTVTGGSTGGVCKYYKEKFSREASNLSRLKHPHIVKVLEAFEANNTVYYAMEFLDGGSLDSLIRQRNGLPADLCLKYVRQIASALTYMHAHKMLHLDLKPGNIMLRRNGDAVLIDFGLSKQYDEDGRPETSTTVGRGTPGYAPIEQATYREGKGFPVTIDVYALGATLFKMLTGERPPEASELLNDDSLLPGELKLHGVDSRLIECVEKAMSVRVKDRYLDVKSFLNSLLGEEDECMVVSVEPSAPAQADDGLPFKVVMPLTEEQKKQRITYGHCYLGKKRNEIRGMNPLMQKEKEEDPMSAWISTGRDIGINGSTKKNHPIYAKKVTDEMNKKEEKIRMEKAKDELGSKISAGIRFHF